MITAQATALIDDYFEGNINLTSEEVAEAILGNQSITRVEVIGAYQISLQDEGRTIKLFESGN